MALGESAANAACLAADEHSTVQAVDYPKLRDRLQAAGQVLEFERAK
jgi:hypothetical protein